MSYFQKVKDAFKLNARKNLEKLGIKIVGENKEWLNGRCALCDDKSGSARYSYEGFLQCFQCNQKLDLAGWVAKSRGCSAWDAAQFLGAELRVELPKRRIGEKPPRELSPKILEQAVNNLFEAPEAELARKFLRDRGLYDQEVLAKFGVGWLGGLIIFAQRDEAGQLRPRYRRYHLTGPLKWTWSPGRGGAQGMWPYLSEKSGSDKLDSGQSILLVEGEWDALAAWIILRAQDQGFQAVTWTGGAGAPIPAHMIPKAWKGRQVHVCYDNDTFQGHDWTKHSAPDRRKHLDMERRHDNLIHGVASRLAACQCEVHLRAVPLNALEHWGGDLRDWIAKGNRHLTEIPSWPWEECRRPEVPIQETTFGEAFTLAGKRSKAKFRAAVAAVDGYAIAYPKALCLKCPMGQISACTSCQGPQIAPHSSIDMKEHAREIAIAYSSSEPQRWLLKNLIGQPSSCPKAEIVTEEAEPGSKFFAVGTEAGESQLAEMLVIAKENPTLSGEVEITGNVHIAGTTYVTFADKVEDVDRTNLDIRPFINDLTQITLPDPKSVDEIEEYLQRRALDLSANVTRIWGRPELHIAHDLMAHSAQRIKVGKHSHRGWIDMAITGETASGKSLTFRRLFEHHGLGVIHACMDNISRAGLTMGASTDKRMGIRLKPGLFPRCHRKMLVLDETHMMIENSKENPMLWLQSARDEGIVYGIKIYGDRKLNAEVRFATIGNWAKGLPTTFRWPAQHFLYFYEVPEAIRRLDFGLIVQGAPDYDEVEIEHLWTSEMTSLMILRAWAQEIDQIHIDDAAVKLAKDLCSEWKEIYHYEEIPLFTPEEKVYSVLRQATACANICWTHPKDAPLDAHVRKEHVEWVAYWLESAWKNSGYDDYSRITKQADMIRKPYHAEHAITLALNLKESDDAKAVLPQVMEGFQAMDVQSFTGVDHYQAMQWVGNMIRLNMIRMVESSNGRFKHYRMTKGGHHILKNVLSCAEDFPGEYAHRYHQLEQWAFRGMSGNPDIVPTTLSSAQLNDLWSKSASKRVKPIHKI